MFAKVFVLLSLALLGLVSGFMVAVPVGSRVAGGQGGSGRSGSSLKMAQCVFPGNKKTDADKGTRLNEVAKKAGYKPQYGCEEGKCGTCAHRVNGKPVRLCIGKVPAGAGPFTFVQGK